MNTADLPADWQAVLAAEFAAPYFQKLAAFVDAERAAHPEAIFPAEGDVFNALKLTPLTEVKVVVLGQDPYPTRGHAHGLAFSVQPHVKPLPASLRNVVKELETDLGIGKPSSGSLLPWAQQGVLLLNAVLTVREGAANSHQKQGWETFTDAVIRAVSAKSEPVVFLLWGKPAQKKAELVDTSKHTVLNAPHPSPLARDPVTKQPMFFGSKPFSQANAALKASGRGEIDWSL